MFCIRDVARACPTPIELGGFLWIGLWRSLTASIRFWEGDVLHAAKLGGADQAASGTGEGRTDQQNVGHFQEPIRDRPADARHRRPPASMGFRVN